MSLLRRLKMSMATPIKPPNKHTYKQNVVLWFLFSFIVWPGYSNNMGRILERCLAKTLFSLAWKCVKHVFPSGSKNNSLFGALTRLFFLFFLYISIPTVWVNYGKHNPTDNLIYTVCVKNTDFHTRRLSVSSSFNKNISKRRLGILSIPSD